MSITFSGLSSGLDSASMIDQLVSIERSAATTVSTKKSNLDTQKAIVNGLSSALSSLATATRALDISSEVKPRTAVVSDSRVSAAVSSAAATGSHEIRVSTLAAAQITQSKTFSTSGAGALGGSGSVDITVAGVTKNVAWTNTDSLDTVAARINAANAGVTASVVKVDATNYRVVVAAQQTGEANAPTFVDNGTNILDLASASNIKQPASDASVTIDGVEIKRSTNVISDAVAGVTFTLNATHAATDPTTKTTVSMDVTALTDKVKKLVDAYNSVENALDAQLGYTGTTKGENTLFGDSTLRGLQSALGGVASAKYGNDNLSTIGLTRDKSGTMSLDAAKLASALAADPDAVERVFVTNGFASAVTGLTDCYTAADGLLAAKTQSLTERQRVLQTRIDRINTQADDLRTRLERQFSALEEAISKMKTQSSYLTSML